MKPRFVWALLSSAVLISGVLSAEARAADPASEEARKHFQIGQDFFDVGRWDEAAEEFERAYALRKDPTLLYYMAQA